MCSTTTSPIGLSSLLMDSLLSATSHEGSNDLAAQYTSSLLNLERSQAQARLSAQHSVANGVAAREKHQLQAAQEAGKARTGHAASNFALDSGSLLQLMADQTRQTQSESLDITRQTVQGVESQRLNEVYYGQKKDLLRQEYKHKHNKTASKTLLGGYNQFKSGLMSFLG